MNFVGYGLPFVVAGLEHSPERLSFPLEGLLGPFWSVVCPCEPEDSVGVGRAVAAAIEVRRDPRWVPSFRRDN